MPAERVPEAVLSRIWNDGWHSRELRTVDGYRVGVVYRGVWSHSNGPDFRDAMLEINGRLATGSVELHVRSSQWNDHGHQDNPAYDDVIMHVVLEDDAADACCGPSGVRVPTLVIAPYLTGSVQDFVREIVPLDLGSLGARACLPTLAGGRTGAIHSVLRREGWRRMQEKQLRFQQEMILRPPGEVLYRGMLDSLGLSKNRGGMADVADRLPLALAERIVLERGPAGILAAMLGIGGFLPLSPTHQTFVVETGMEPDVVDAAWYDIHAALALSAISGNVWNLNRVRPLNHPARRLASMASLLSATAEAGLLPTVLQLTADGESGWDRLLSDASPSVGESRRRQILINTFAPFVTAHAEVTGDDGLSERAGAIWDNVAGAVDDDVARKTLRQITGGKRFPVRSALEVQGLHQIGRNGCAHLRCFECPIAALAVTYESPVASA